MSLLRELENQYSVTTAEITAKLGRIQRIKDEAEKCIEISACDKLLKHDAADLIEQMEIALHGISSENERSKYANQLSNFKADLKLLASEFKRICGSVDTRSELLGDDHDDNQKAQLLANTELLERSSKMLEDGYRIAIETEQVGADILRNLDSQRATLTGTRERLRIADEDLSDTSRVLNRMIRRVIQNRTLLLFVVAFLVLILIILVASSFRN